MEPPPPARPGTALRILATTDLAATLVPIRRSYGDGGTCAGVARLLDREAVRQPTVWLDAGDFTVGPTARLLGRRPWEDMAELPIAAAVAGNHEFDEGCRPCWRRSGCSPTPALRQPGRGPARLGHGRDGRRAPRPRRPPGGAAARRR